jgi:hypothetical protein
MFDAGTGMGASEFVAWPEIPAPGDLLAPASTPGARRAVPEIVVDAAAEAGGAHMAAHAMRISGRLTTRE